MFSKPVPDGPDSDLSRPIRRKAEYARGDTAEGKGPQSVFRAHIEGIGIAVGKILLKRGGQGAGNNGTHDMYDLPCGKIIAVCQHGNSGWLLIAAAVTGAEPGHTAAALSA